MKLRKNLNALKIKVSSVQRLKWENEKMLLTNRND